MRTVLTKEANETRGCQRVGTTRGWMWDGCGTTRGCQGVGSKQWAHCVCFVLQLNQGLQVDAGISSLGVGARVPRQLHARRDIATTDSLFTTRW
jgi:hypothetical protein